MGHGEEDRFKKYLGIKGNGQERGKWVKSGCLISGLGDRVADNQSLITLVSSFSGVGGGKWV